MRRALVLAVTGLASAAVLAGPVAGAASASSYPPPCPIRQLVNVSNGTLYLSVGCTTVAVPLPAYTV